MGTIIGDYIGTTIGIHSPIPDQAPGGKQPSSTGPETQVLKPDSLRLIPSET